MLARAEFPYESRRHSIVRTPGCKASRVLAENVEGVRRLEDHRVMIEFPIVAI